ncbi:MAG: ectoine hydroxylase-related dioxygenase (phytanoyl-CoA dioxygenase family) [Candidatus Latescibacterota bacterium]|jgi:ectoine hydroxylase-related dioxygenase (phytanoyl-CoA dioxygenase family)
MGFGLTQEQINQFHDEGYLILPAVFDADEVQKMREEADFILELTINSSICNDRKSRRLDIRSVSAGYQVVRKVQPINDLSLYLAQVSADDRLVKPLAQLMDDTPVLMEEKLNYKEPLPNAVDIDSPEVEDQFPVHNDWAYYAAQNYPQSIISSAISMDECTPKSGPLRIWPGSHKQHLEHEKMPLGLQIKEGLIDFDGGQDVLCPAGSVMLFHTVLVHNSRANTSGKPRRLMIYSHYPESANMGIDVRNGPTRLRESPYELAYLRAKDKGLFADVFSAPVF